MVRDGHLEIPLRDEIELEMPLSGKDLILSDASVANASRPLLATERNTYVQISMLELYPKQIPPLTPDGFLYPGPQGT